MSIRKIITAGALIITTLYALNGYYHVAVFSKYSKEHARLDASLMVKRYFLNSPRTKAIKTKEQEEINNEMKKEVIELEQICNEIGELRETARGRIFNPFYSRF